MNPGTWLAVQNPDGGWPFRRGSSWTEPTVLALLAEMAADRGSQRIPAAVEWLRRTQRRDGGWGPAPGVDCSTWVTALVALLPAELLGSAHERVIGWLLKSTGRETSLRYRIEMRLFGSSLPAKVYSSWPWFPGAAGWVQPTAISILALRKAADPSSEVTRRIAEGRDFLWQRMCSDGGWNHGSSRALGYDAPSYPETTGLALLALGDADEGRLKGPLDCARKHFSACRSAEGLAWLRLAFAALDKAPPQNVFQPPLRGVRDEALWLLAAAAEKGTNFIQ